MGYILRIIILNGVLLTAIGASGEEKLPTLPVEGASTSNVTSMPDRTISVTCYLGNPNDRQTLGSMTVPNPEAAGPACNSYNFSCRGRCYGCYSDFDLSEDVCVDNSGRKFLR